jgi:hypothetical protein
VQKGAESKEADERIRADPARTDEAEPIIAL